MNQGDEADKLYCLQMGEVEVLVGATLFRVAVLKEGTVFGEMAMFNHLGSGFCKRSATIRALSFCDCRVINHVQFHSLLKQFPKERHRFEKLAQERKAANEANEKLKAGQAQDKDDMKVQARRRSSGLWQAIKQKAALGRRASLPVSAVMAQDLRSQLRRTSAEAEASGANLNSSDGHRRSDEDEKDSGGFSDSNSESSSSSAPSVQSLHGPKTTPPAVRQDDAAAALQEAAAVRKYTTGELPEVIEPEGIEAEFEDEVTEVNIEAAMQAAVMREMRPEPSLIATPVEAKKPIPLAFLQRFISEDSSPRGPLSLPLTDGPGTGSGQSPQGAVQSATDASHDITGVSSGFGRAVSDPQGAERERMKIEAGLANHSGDEHPSWATQPSRERHKKRLPSLRSTRRAMPNLPPSIGRMAEPTESPYEMPLLPSGSFHSAKPGGAIPLKSTSFQSASPGSRPNAPIRPLEVPRAHSFRSRMAHA
eukprot:CAMPEP_0197706968 /NCGR_PEP_ID=MMETSP1338-20131121/127214_1 /TAXON_ID=43686 ORGANISM="Pelagodinium beii, Strain RCC1491" /NCGR_SAMPLE_ID=MMETSP1338 /ASSEMBLY_ACC=CAM_ASM_000754 /LENGTH=478 /DNA_ID=CAMNT_0043290887 /DNA_START=105 /DNA_END=1541 /DNA_ORIENTATION=-